MGPPDFVPMGPPASTDESFLRGSSVRTGAPRTSQLPVDHWTKSFPTSFGRPRFSIRPIGHESLVLGPHAPRRIFDVTLDLQLIEPLFRRQLSIERYALAFDCRKISRGQEFHERELQPPPLFRVAAFLCGFLAEGHF